MKKYRVIIIITIIVIVALILSPIKPIKNLFNQVLSPISSRLFSSSNALGSFLENVRSINGLADENDRIVTENNELNAQIAKMDEIKHENEVLKKELNFINSQKDLEFIGAKIVSKSISPFLKYLTVDQGAKHGVQKNRIVMSQGYLVGKVSEVFDDYSQIELITSPNIIIPVILQQSRATGLLSSNLEGFSIDDVPVDNKINDGEKVLTNNLDEDIPADIMIGKVEHVDKLESLLFQNITISSPIEFEKLEYVFILK